MRRRPLLALFVLTAGCLNEYHPEYHAQTSTTYVQNVSYPTTYVTQVLAPAPAAASHASTPPRERRAVAWSRPGAAPQGAPAAAAAPSLEPPETHGSSPARVADGTDLGNADRAPRRAPVLDLGELKVRCRSGDRAGCRELPGIHMSGNVQIHGNVTMFGDVYLNDSAGGY